MKLAMAVAAILVILSGGAWLLLKNGPTGPIVTAADIIAAPADAPLTSEKVVAPSRLCFSGGCPSLSRTWPLDEMLDMSQLLALTASARSMTPNGSCALDPNSFGQYPICSVAGTAVGDGETFSYTLTQFAKVDPVNPDVAAQFVLTLNVVP